MHHHQHEAGSVARRITLGLADSALEGLFGPEYRDLPSEHRQLVLGDFAEAEVSIGEYRDLIGPGNLRSYADTLVVQARRAGEV